MRIWPVVAIASVLIFLGLALCIGGSVWYTRSQIQHECQALNIVRAIPVPSPVNAQTERNFVFHQALVQWAEEDGC